MRLAWYGAQSATRIFDAEFKLGLKAQGRTLDFRAVVQPNKTLDIGGTTDWLFSPTFLGNLIDGAEKGKRKIWWSIAPFGADGNWSSAAAGSYDGQFTTLMNNIVGVESRNGNDTGPIEFRLAFEFNGDWFWWKARGNESNMISTWRRYKNIAENIAPGRFKFEWAPSETTQLQGTYADPNACWPGDSYVDVCGLDIYWKPFSQEQSGWTQWGKDADAAFDKALGATLGLNWLKTFAANHGNKRMAISEWGVQPATAITSGETVLTEPYIRKFAAWCRTNNVSTLYWNGYSGEGFVGDIITHDNWPKQFNAIKDNFVAYADNSSPFGADTGGNTGGSTGGSTGGWVSNREPDPYAANQQINTLTYNKTTLTSAEIAQINDLSYWPLVASGRKSDSSYTGPMLSLGDVTSVQQQLNTANADKATLQTSLDTATSQNATLQSQVTSLNTQLTAQKAATKTATDNYTASQAQVTNLTTQLNAATAARDTALNDLAAANTARDQAIVDKNDAEATAQDALIQVGDSLTAISTAQNNEALARTAETAAKAARDTALANLQTTQNSLTTAQADLANKTSELDAANTQITELEAALEAGGGEASVDLIQARAAITVARDALAKVDQVFAGRKAVIEENAATVEDLLAQIQTSIDLIQLKNSETTAP